MELSTPVMKTVLGNFQHDKHIYLGGGGEWISVSLILKIVQNIKDASVC